MSTIQHKELKFNHLYSINKALLIKGLLFTTKVKFQKETTSNGSKYV